MNILRIRSGHIGLALSLLSTFALLAGCGASAEPDATKTSAPVTTQAPRTLDDVIKKPAAPVIPTTVDGPLIKFEEIHKNFGKVPDTDDLIHKFNFTNAGTGTLIIHEVKPSCGCTTTSLERSDYAPGQGGSIDVDWDPKGHGPQSKTITIRSNSKRTPIVQLRISATIEPFLVVTPPRAEFNLVQRGTVPELLLTISCQDKDLEILEVQGTTPDLEASLVAPAKDGKAQIRVSISEKNPRRGIRRFYPKVKVKARAKIRGASFPVEHTHEISVLATIYDELAPDPAFFGVGRVAPGSMIVKEVTVSRPSGEPFKITAARLDNFMEGDSSTVQFKPVTVAGKEAYKVVLNCKPGAYEGPLRGKVVLETDVPGEEELRLDVFGVSGAPKPK